jgi:hypothetical protein
MTTAFQNVIDNAESISIFKRKRVAQTQARDGTVRTVSLGGQTWEFAVRLPDGPRWTDYRGIIEQIEALDRVTVGQIKINRAGHSWISQYQGNLTNPNATVVTAAAGNTLTITATSNSLSSGLFRFRSGDIIQLGSTGSVYSVVNDVAHNGTTITVNRPIRQAPGSYTLAVGPAVTWSVICTQFPNWTLFARDQVSWSGEFIFAEAL